jgi:hypothetical protein
MVQGEVQGCFGDMPGDYCRTFREVDSLLPASEAGGNAKFILTMESCFVTKSTSFRKKPARENKRQ